MLTISLTLASVGLFGAHAWDLYQNVRPGVVRATIRNF